MADIITLNPDAKKPHFAIMAMCLVCNHRWMGLVVPETSLFQLECPMCHLQKSFASFMPQSYLEATASLPDPA